VIWQSPSQDPVLTIFLSYRITSWHHEAILNTVASGFIYGNIGIFCGQSARFMIMSVRTKFVE
ncbi:MAG TPA: hypothetical protein PK411_12145, partial [Mesotoga infera]|nr:hypothetical protein [Mesotoga infera]HRR44912.1 hypothetical protein [Mesotoga sp.]